MPRFDVFLSHAGADKPAVERLATKLREAGVEPFLDKWHLIPGERWQEALEEALDQSRTCAVFIGKTLGPWQDQEMRSALETQVQNRSFRVIPVLLPGGRRSGEEKLPRFLRGLTWVDFRAGLDDEDAFRRLLAGIRGEAPGTGDRVEITSTFSGGSGEDRDRRSDPLIRPGLFRFVLDRLVPRLHHFLTRHGTFAQPPELPHLDAYLRELKARIENDIREKTYLPLDATIVPRKATWEEGSQDPFERPIQQVIRQVLGRAQGGDSASAQIAAVNRRSRLVRNILKALLKTEEPLVLLGDPGSGKTMTLMEAALALADSEIGRVFPVVTVYARLGEFHVDGEVGPEDVREYVKRSAPDRIRPWIAELDAAGRLVLLFDGMDEMSRDRYSEHTEALSLFAGALQGRTKTLFSCRITDFSPAFVHHRLVLLPFDTGQITKYLHKYLSVPTLEIDDKRFSIRALARRLASGDLPIDASNPFVLWLLCLYLEERKTWPESRVELIGYYNEKNYARKRKDARKEGILFPDGEEAFRVWSRFAFTITERNRGSAIPVAALLDEPHVAEADERTQLMIRTGKLCGVLAESADEQEHLVRFEHHRFQEYFTAIYISRVNPKIAWLDKLDAPRWQETLLNLVLLGGGEAAVSVLVESIALPIRLNRLRFEEHEEEARKWEARREAAKQRETSEGQAQSPGQKLDKESDEEPKPPKIPAEEETVLADRVELGANLLRQAERSSPAVERLLSPCLLDAVDFLVDRGNPITQVKMMRACQRLKNVDLLKTLEKPLRSPVQWVRNQALILVAATSTGVRTSRSNLATEMGFDLATNSLLPRWPTYLRALSKTGGAGLWWSFLLSTFLSLASLALLLAEAGAIYLGSLVGVRHFSSKLPPWMSSFALPMLERPEAMVAFTLLVVGIAVLAMKSEPSSAWAWILGGALGTVTLGLACLGLWQGEWNDIGGILVAVFFSQPVLLNVIAIAGLIAQVSVLLAYLGLTRGARSAGHPAVSFLSLMWTRSNFDVLEIFGPPITLILVVLVLALVGSAGDLALTLAFEWLAKRVSGLLGLPYLGEVTETSFAILLGLLAWIVWAQVRTLKTRGKGVPLSPGGGRAEDGRVPHATSWHLKMGKNSAGRPPIFRAVPHATAWHLRLGENPPGPHPIFKAGGQGVKTPSEASGSTWGSLGRWLRAHANQIAIFGSIATGILAVIGLIYWLITSHGQQVGQGCVFLLLAVYVIILLLLLLRMLRYAITARWMYPPRSFTPETWKDLMKNASPKRQEDILLRTHHQSLGVNAVNYLQVLKEIEPLVREEPALSTYWDQRDQLEQALRQERRG